MGTSSAPRKHSHYFRDVSALKEIDVYRTLELWGITDPCLQHALKKLLVPGKRGAGKDMAKDVQEAIDSLQRWQEMREEDSPAVYSMPFIHHCMDCSAEKTVTKGCDNPHCPISEDELSTRAV